MNTVSLWLDLQSGWCQSTRNIGKLLVVKSVVLNHRGFTLVELIIVVAIVAILAAVALPSYQAQVAEAKRSEAQVALQSLAVALETYYRKNLTYQGPVFYANNDRENLSPTELYPEYLPKDYASADYATKATYRLSFSTQTANTYTIVATAQGAHASADAGCGTMTLNHLGVVTPAGCWQ